LTAQQVGRSPAQIISPEDPERTMLMTGPNREGIYRRVRPPSADTPVPFKISVKAAGYEEWAYDDVAKDKHAGALQQETKELTIRLRPAGESSL